MKITIRCGDIAVAGLNEALLPKAARAKLLRTDKVRADTTVVEADVACPTDSGLLAKAVGNIARTVDESRPRAARPAPSSGTGAGARDDGPRSIASKLKLPGRTAA